MDHVDFVVLFLSISSWLVGSGIAFAVRNSRYREMARQYLLFVLPIALFFLQEMVFYYLENGSITTLPVWVIVLYSHITVTVFALCSWRVFFLCAAMTGEAFGETTVRRINAIWLVGYFVATGFLAFEAAYDTGSIIVELPAIILFVAGFGAAAMVAVHRAARGESKRRLYGFSAVIALVLLVFLEDLVVSVFDNMIFYPYVFLVVNLYFIRLFAAALAEGGGAESSRDRIRDSVAAYDVSSREADVVELLVQGKNRGEIGAALYISENTVKTHIANVYRKLNVTSRNELVELLNGEID